MLDIHDSRTSLIVDNATALSSLSELSKIPNRSESSRVVVVGRRPVFFDEDDSNASFSQENVYEVPLPDTPVHKYMILSAALYTICPTVYIAEEAASAGVSPDTFRIFGTEAISSHEN